MIPNIVKGKGISGALAYAMGQGNDPVTKERLFLLDGQQSRATLLGGQNFGFEIDNADRLELARRVMEWQGLPENQAGKTRNPAEPAATPAAPAPAAEAPAEKSPAEETPPK